MPHITSSTISNADAANELSTLARQGLPVYYPPQPQPTTDTKGDQRKGVTAPTEGSDQPSPGISSSTSERMPDKSGSSAPATESSLQSPAPTAENPSSQDPASRPAQSSTAPLTSGSTQETGASQPDPSNSSAAQATPVPSATAATLPPSGRELIQAARTEYDARNWDVARQLLMDAKAADPSLEGEVAVALQAVQTASEATPSAGGFLVQ